MNKRIKKKINTLPYKLKKLKLDKDDILIVDFNTNYVTFDMASKCFNNIKNYIDNKSIPTINGISINKKTKEELKQLKDIIEEILK